VLYKPHPSAAAVFQLRPVVLGGDKLYHREERKENPDDLSQRRITMISRRLPTTIAIFIAIAICAPSNLFAKPPTAVKRNRAKNALRGPCFFDTARFFKESVHFKAAIEELQKTIQDMESKMNAEKDELHKKTELLPLLTEERRAEMTEQIKQAKADLVVRISIQRKEFMDREAAIYKEHWQRIQRVIAAYCKSNGITSVLRVDTKVISDSDPQAIIRMVNNPVVWYSPEMDITDEILKKLNAEPVKATPKQTTP